MSDNENDTWEDRGWPAKPMPADEVERLRPGFDELNQSVRESNWAGRLGPPMRPQHELEAEIASLSAALTAAAEREQGLREENERLTATLKLEQKVRSTNAQQAIDANATLAAERHKGQALREEILARIDALSNSGHPEDKAIKTSLQSTLTDMDALGLPSPDAPQPPGTTREET